MTSLRGALVTANLVEAIDSLHNVTIFAPTNEAFQAIGSALGSLTAEQVVSTLTYHAVVAEAPGYSSELTNGTMLKSVNGVDLTITILDSGIFVNSARVVVPDVLISNGIVHIIDA